MSWLAAKSLFGLARGIWVLVAIGALVAVGFLLSSALSGGRSAKVKGDLAAGQADAAIASGQDAAGTVAGAGARESAIDQQTRENEHAIRNAPGADAPVDPRARDVGMQSLCKRAAYSGDPRCVQLAPAD